MSQQYDCPLPPPPPSPRSGGTSTRAGSVSGSVAPQADARSVSENLHVHRTRPVSAVLPSITTTCLSPQGVYSSQASTPVSGNRLSPGIFPYAPGTPSGLNPQTPGGLVPPPPPPATPRSPNMEPYNPLQWSRGQVSGSQMVFQQRHSTMPPSTMQLIGQEGMLVSFLSDGKHSSTVSEARNIRRIPGPTEISDLQHVCPCPLTADPKLL